MGLELLPQEHGYRVLQLGAAQLDHVGVFLGLGLHGLDQLVQGVQQLAGHPQRRQLSRRGKHVVGGLGHVHVIVGMYQEFSQLAPQNLRGPVGDHLVGVHVGRSARAALNGVHDKLVPQLARQHLVAGPNDSCGDFRLQGARPLIGHGRRLLDDHQAVHHVGMHQPPGHGEVLLGPYGLY